MNSSPDSNLSNILGEKNINIAGMQVSQDELRSEVVAVINNDAARAQLVLGAVTATIGASIVRENDLLQHISYQESGLTNQNLEEMRQIESFLVADHAQSETIRINGILMREREVISIYTLQPERLDFNHLEYYDLSGLKMRRERNVCTK